MRNLFWLFLPLLLGCSASPDWLNQVPSSEGLSQDWSAVPAESFFEVPASRLAAAEAWLSDKPYLVQDQSGLVYFGRPGFKCTANQSPYLVRAQYVNGGTGRFDLLWTKASALVVAHASLGPDGPPSKTAIIACLPHAPTAVYSSISGAL